MSEKRFTIFGEWHKDCVIDEIRDNTGEYVTIGRVVDLLNGNERLQTHLSQLAKSNCEGVKKVQSLAKENEQLKSENQELKQLLKAYKQSNDDYQYQIHKAVTEKLTMLELADNCGVDVE